MGRLLRLLLPKCPRHKDGRLHMDFFDSELDKMVWTCDKGKERWL